MSDTCKKCRFSAAAKDDLLECRRHAPALHGNSFRTWVKVWPDDWCGEFQPDRGSIGEMEYRRG